MKNLLLALCFVLFSGIASFAQTETTVIARYGISPQGAGYKLVEVFTSTESGWIPIDAGYIDFRNASQYRELFIGTGKVFVADKKTLLIGEIYFDQASDGAAYLQPWILVAYKFTPTVRAEAVYFPYIPLNEAGTAQHVIERVKLEKIFKGWKIGGGYSGYKFGDGRMASKPFATFTKITEKWGNPELWLQKTPTGIGIQFRFTKSFK